MPIVIEHLNYIYMAGGPYETKALDDVSLTIGDGEFVGLIGHRDNEIISLHKLLLHFIHFGRAQ